MAAARRCVSLLAVSAMGYSLLEKEDVTPRCAAPAAAGAHVLYNASFADATHVRELKELKYIHAVVDGDAPLGRVLHGACPGDVRTFDGPAEVYPEEFEHLSENMGARLIASVVAVTSAEDYLVIDALHAKEFDKVAKLINEDRLGVNAFDAAGTPALSVAVQLRKPIIAVSLLNAYDPRVRVDAATAEGYTALHYAVGTGDRNVVKALLRRGANPNAQIRQARSGGWAPLHFACRAGDVKMAEALLEYDADPLLQGFAGENAFKVAEDASVAFTVRKKLAELMNAAMTRKAGGGGEL